MKRRKMIDRRNGRASMRQLADAVGSTTSTIAEMMYGTRDTQQSLLDAVADALEVDRVTVSSWAGRARALAGPFVPHPDAELLDADERKAVNELIRLMARPKKSAERGRLSVAPDTSSDLPAAAMQDDSDREQEEKEMSGEP